MKQIISGTGHLTDLKIWQQFRGLKGDKISDNFLWTEFDHKGELILSEILIDLIQVVRLRWKKPLVPNSGYRTQEKQNELKEQGYRTATTSPHVKGMAVDLETKTAKETKELAELVLLTARQLKLGARVGFRQYLNNGQTFVHVDICPEYYGKGKPWHDHIHPAVWETPYLTW